MEEDSTCEGVASVVGNDSSMQLVVPMAAAAHIAINDLDIYFFISVVFCFG
jgi:hypothetical protein